MKCITVFGSAKTSSDHLDYVAAEHLGRALASLYFCIVTGGYGGIMEAVSKGAYEAGGDVIGITVPGLFPDYAKDANKYVTREIKCATYAEREQMMYDSGDAHIVFPGTFGSFAEFTNALIARLVGPRIKPLVAFEHPWRQVVTDFETSSGGRATARDGGIPVHYVGAIKVATVFSVVEEIVTILKRDVQTGYLELHLGPMYSGKTSVLIDAANASRSSIFIIPELLGRFDSHTSHNNVTIRAKVVAKLMSVRKELEAFSTIVIDEAQFFPDLQEFVLACIDAGQSVIVGGLNGNVLLEKMGSINDLVPFADKIVHHQSRCHFCDAPASFTTVVSTTSLATVVDGIRNGGGVCVGDQHYVPVCRKHRH